MPKQRALVIVDPLKDFCPGGALEVPAGDAIFPVINRLARSEIYATVALVREEHPAEHISFASRHGKDPFQKIRLPGGREQMLWPDHCVSGSAGAEVFPELEMSPIDLTVWKGQRREVENYSGFADADGSPSGLAERLREHDIDAIDVCGLALDYCVRETALDGVDPAFGFETRLVLDATRGIDAAEGDIDRSLDQMRKAGVEIVESEQILAEAS